MGSKVWQRGASPRQTVVEALKVLSNAAVEAKKEDVHIHTLYISINDPITLEPLADDAARAEGKGAILSGAAMIGEGQEGRRTRLIDNLLLGFAL
jgi:pantoate--beta-alanine ligase